MPKRQRTAESSDKGAQALMEEHGRGLLCISVAETSLAATMEVMEGPPRRRLLAAALGDAREVPGAFGLSSALCAVALGRLRPPRV